MMDVLGLTVEGERRLATRMQEIEELRREHEQRMKEIDLRLVEISGQIAKTVVTHAETDEKLNALIGVVDGFIRGKN